ncbi:hypothetical protein PMAYCL1PPCAC_26484, partial [Pristionchus mayeri]
FRRAMNTDKRDSKDTPMVADLKKQLAKIGRMPEMSVNVDRPVEAMSSSHSPRSPPDSNSKMVDSFSQMGFHDFSYHYPGINVVDTQQMRNEGVLDNKSWDSLPWPAVDRICYNLFHRHRIDNSDLSDLANLAQVSTHYFSDVSTFMSKVGNKPVKPVSLKECEIENVVLYYFARDETIDSASDANDVQRENSLQRSMQMGIFSVSAHFISSLH